MGETSTNVANINIAQGMKIRVEDGCDLSDPCELDPCTSNSYCNNEWSTYTCDCEPGKHDRQASNLINPQ